MSFYIRILIICAISYSSCSNPNRQNINTQEVLKTENQKKINFNIIKKKLNKFLSEKGLIIFE